MIKRLVIANLCALLLLLTTATLDIAFWHGSVAQSVIGPFSITCNNTPGCGFSAITTDPVILAPSSPTGFELSCTTNDINATGNFSDQNCLALQMFASDGQYDYGAGTEAKRTFQPMSILATYPASGQKTVLGEGIDCRGMGDCAIGSPTLTYSNGPMAGDEGIGFADVSYVRQQGQLALSQLTGNAIRTSCNTTLSDGVLAPGAPVAQVSAASWSGGNITYTISTDLTIGGQNLPALTAGARVDVSGSSVAGYNVTAGVITTLTSTTMVIAAANPGSAYIANEAIVKGPGIVSGGAPNLPQVVSVASTSGCTVGDWLEIDHVLPGGTYGIQNNEAVQITAVGSGTISAVFKDNHSHGAAVTPALVLPVNTTNLFGQNRKAVNLSGASYATGTVTGISEGQVGTYAVTGFTYDGTSHVVTMTVTNTGSNPNFSAGQSIVLSGFTGANSALNGTQLTSSFGGQTTMIFVATPGSYTTQAGTVLYGGFSGTGTSWAANMVGGDSTNIGCIALDADTYTGSPFDQGSGSNGPLHSWYEITSVASSTQLGISSFSVANAQSYRGKGPGPNGTGGSTAYIIRPCSEVLRLVGSSIIAEGSLATWSNTHQVEAAISPFPDITGFQYKIGSYTTGGTLRSFFDIKNSGAREFGGAVSVNSQMALASNSDGVAFSNAFEVGGKGTGGYAADIGFNCIADIQSACINMPNDTTGKIQWTGGGAYINPNTANAGLQFQVDSGGSSPGNDGFLTAYGHNSGVLGAGGSIPGLTFGGALGTAVHVYADLPACAPGSGHAGYEGMEVAISNSNTATFGATISGTGSNHVKAYCDGTNWTAH